MNKKMLFMLVVISCLISLLAFISAIMKRFPDSQTLQTAVTNSNVAVTIRSGALRFSKTPVPNIAAVDASVSDQTVNGTLGTVEVTDLRAVRGAGWTVNIDSITNYYSSDKSESIPLANTKFSVKNLTVSHGNSDFVTIPTDLLTPADSNSDGISDSAITIAQTAGTASGKTYPGVNVVSFIVDMSLTVPGGLSADTYNSSYVISVQ